MYLITESEPGHPPETTVECDTLDGAQAIADMMCDNMRKQGYRVSGGVDGRRLCYRPGRLLDTRGVLIEVQEIAKPMRRVIPSEVPSLDEMVNAAR